MVLGNEFLFSKSAEDEPIMQSRLYIDRPLTDNRV